MSTILDDNEAYALFLIIDTVARIHKGDNEEVNYLRERLLPVYRDWHKENPFKVHPALAMPAPPTTPAK